MTQSQMLPSVTSISYNCRKGAQGGGARGHHAEREDRFYFLSTQFWALLTPLPARTENKIFSPVCLFIIPTSLGVLYISWDVK